MTNDKAGEARLRAIARIIDPDDFEHEWAFETARAIACLPASPPGQGVVARMTDEQVARFLSEAIGGGLSEMGLKLKDPWKIYLPAVASFREALSRLTQGGDAELPTQVEAEREACAKIADGFRSQWCNAGGFGGHSAAARIIADAIRSRVPSADLHRHHPTPGSELSGAEQGDDYRKWAEGEIWNLREIVRDVCIMANCGQFAEFEGEPWLVRVRNIDLNSTCPLAASPSPNPNAGEGK